MATAETATVESPRGIFASSGALDSAVINHAQVQGVLIRVAWSDIEPSAGNYTMTPIRNQLRLVQQANTQWSLAVLGGPKSPTWLYSLPYLVSPMLITFRGQPTLVPKFWDSKLQERLALLASALGSEFGNDPNLKLVYLPQMSANGIEGHFNGNPDLVLTSQGLTEDRWVDSVLGSARAFAAAFPDKALAVELHDLLGSAAAGKRIMSGIQADTTLTRQTGVAMWWLSGKSDYQADLLTAIAGFPGPVYTQLIDQSANASSFAGNDYSKAFDQARSLGFRYAEPWPEDVKSGRWDSLFADFNSWALAN